MDNSIYTVKGNIVNPVERTIKGAEITVENGQIKSIIFSEPIAGPFVLPGFIDSHVHIESSMLLPSRFAEMAVKHGTVAVVTDPHEVANVAGVAGIRFMQDNSAKVPFNFFFGVPSCIPASPLEKSGAVLNAKQVSELIAEDGFYFLAEMMNFPGVTNSDEEVIKKIEAAKNSQKPIDGHVPGLSGMMLQKYINAGISTDHECSSQAEAEEKIRLGMKIQIREGSAAKNFENLSPLLSKYPKDIMFCTDDCHPDYLKDGHINRIVSRAIGKGYDLFDTIYAACITPIDHYNLPIGKLRIGDPADFVLVNNLEDFDVIETHIKGKPVYKDGNVQYSQPEEKPENFLFREKYIGDLSVIATGRKMHLIEAIDGELLTKNLVIDTPVELGSEVLANTQHDILKIVLLDRYSDTPPQVAFIKGFGLKKGALAASIAHDSHHIVAVGCDDVSLEASLKWIVENRGGICFFNGVEGEGLRLPYFGLMTDEYGEKVSELYEQLNNKVKDSGCSLKSPFMTASFMALTVIPEIKINHNGLFDSINFKTISLFE
jgi:adenine deaminase